MPTDDPHDFPIDMQCRLFEQAGDAIFVLSEAGKIISANEAACTYLGYSKDELLGLLPQQICSPEYAGTFPERLRRVKAEGQCTFEMIHRHRDGSEIPVEIHSRLVHQGNASVILSICRDITARKRIEIEYRSIIQAAGDGYWAVRTADARIIDVNEKFCRMVGYSRDELLSMTISDLEVSESREDTATHIRKIIETGHDIFETRHRHRDGHILEFEISTSYADTDGGVIFVFTRDISARKQQEAELKLSALIFNASTASIMATDAHNRIVSVNPAFTLTSGYEMHEVIGRDPRILQSGRQGKEFYRRMWQMLNEEGHWEGEWWNRRKSGEEYAEQVAMNVVRNSDGSVYRYVKIASDITKKKHLDDLIWRQAHYDAVTNLPNRRLFFAQLESELRKCRETGQLLALYFVDLDGFKEVNDTFGHDIGDQLLVEAAQRIARSIRGSDTVARLGGDEFIVMLSGLRERTRVEPLGRKILEILAHPYRFGAVEARISASIGIALYPTDGKDIDELLKKADQAMYSAKNGGKNTLSYAL
jgi:diguanylate cyclase (GGDEF)-like protein/PAS domain S-box-containing protein